MSHQRETSRKTLDTWTEYMSQLAKEHLGVLLSELEKVTRGQGRPGVSAKTVAITTQLQIKSQNVVGWMDGFSLILI